MIELNKTFKQRILKGLAVCLFTAMATPLLAQNTDFKPGGKVWGESFGDYFYKIHADSFGRGSNQYSGLKKDFNAFDLRRVYIGYTYNFTTRFTAEALLSHEGNTVADGNRGVYVKLANLRWKNIFKGTDLIIGQQRTPSFSTPNGSEATWGYRSIEKTIMDYRKLSGSNDLGINLQGNYMDGKYGYDLMLGNNNGAKLPTNSYKRVYADVYAKFFKKHLEVQLYSDYFISRHNKVTGINNDYTRTWNTTKIFLAYMNDRLTAGVELVQQFQGNAAINKDSSFRTVIPFGYSIFARGSILKDSAKMDVLSAFVRFDSWNPFLNQPSELISPIFSSDEAFFTAGIDYQPAKNIHLMPNVWYNGYSAKLSTVKNGYDLAGRITFFYKF